MKNDCRINYKYNEDLITNEGGAATHDLKDFFASIYNYGIAT